ncbi:MAG TPA: MFS transporter [Candidatus Limnocylindrales bacterium]|nr:MFS transporter [Candidatus Limnocylindrales bacterium]
MRIFAKMGLDEIYTFPKRINWTFAFLLAMAVILLADQMVMSPAIPAIQNEFNITDWEIGLIGSAFTLTGAIITLLWGYFCDKFSRKWLLVAAVVLGETACFLTAFARSYEELLLLRVLTGIAIGGAVPVSFSILGDLFTDKQRPRAQAWYGSITNFGIIFGMLIAGFLGPTLGWRIPFIIVSVPNFIFVLGMVIFGDEPKRGAGEQELKDLVLLGRDYQRRIGIKNYVNLLKIPSNIWLFIQGIPGTVAWGVIPFFLIVFYVREKGFSVELATVLLLFLGFGSIVGRLLGGYIGNILYIRDKRLLPIFCGSLQLIGVVPILITLGWPAPEVANFSSIIPPAIIGFFGTAIISTAGPNVQAMLMNVNAPEYRGAISSIFNLTDSIGAGFGPLIGGFLAQRASLGFAMNTATLFWIPCGLLLFVLAFYLPRDAQRLRDEMSEARLELLPSKP